MKKKSTDVGKSLSKFEQKHIVGGLVDPGGGGANTCTVTCNAGYYACCSYFFGRPHCNCQPDGGGSYCDAGGQGATSCSLTEG